MPTQLPTQAPIQMKSNFPHRLNRSGYYDSYCAVCLTTIGSARNEAELTRYEVGHSCNPVRLHDLGREALPETQRPVPLG